MVALFNLIAFEVDNINAAHIEEFIFDWVGIIVGKEENAGYQHFLLFQQCFQ